MNDPLERQEVNATLVDSGKAIGKLAANEAVFRAAVAAYRASSAEAFQHALASVRSRIVNPSASGCEARNAYWSA